MRLPELKLHVIVRLTFALVVGALAFGAWWNWPALQAQFRAFSPVSHSENSVPEDKTKQVELVKEIPDTVRVPNKLFIDKRFLVAPVGSCPEPEPLKMPASLVLDQRRSVRIHSPFNGQIVKMGLKNELTKTSERLSTVPENGLRNSDLVKKGQILCVIHSADVGSMKSDLINQMSLLRKDKGIYDNYIAANESAKGEQIVSGTMIATARQAYENDLNAVRLAVRKMRSFQFTEEEIEIVKREGEKLKEPDAPLDLELERTWAEYPIRAPFDGQIVEMNVSVGQVVDPSLDLFKIANLDRLQVLANVYEEDLPKLQEIDREAVRLEREATPPGGVGASAGLAAGVIAAGEKARSWTISYQATGRGESGSFDAIVSVIDPMQHTGSVTGWVDNTQRQLFIGQAVTAKIHLRPDPTLITVPAGALVESPEGTLVFFQTKEPGVFTRREVAVASRGREVVYLRKTPNAEEARRGAKPIEAGEIVLSRGSVELNAELETLQSQSKK